MPTGFAAADERMHGVDPGDWSWNESWFFSWIDRDGGPAGVFRVGVTPNQERAMLWCFVHVDGAWLAVEESRLALDHLDLADGVAYDRWGLRFAWQPEAPFAHSRFAFAGTALARSGPDAGARLPLAVDLACTATAAPHGTGIGPDDERTAHPTGRFEQSLAVTGTVVVDGTPHAVRAGAHRDRSWGPRDWRQMFTMGDLQSEGRQLYFVGRAFPGLATGYLRDGDAALRPLVCVDGDIAYDDGRRTITRARLVFETPDGARLDVGLEPVAPSIVFDIAHTCPEPEHWLYWRTLVDATVPGWDGPTRGWFETSRYGLA